MPSTLRKSLHWKKFANRAAPKYTSLRWPQGPEVIPPPGSPPAPALDLDSLREAARAMGGSLTAVTADKRDLESLSAKIERSISHAPAQEGQQWQDAGYYLLALLALIMLTFFRRGGSVAVE